MPADELELGSTEEFTYNAEFHSCVLEASRNTLLQVSAQPIFTVLQTHLARSTLPRSFHTAIHAHHIRILEAVEAGDADGAAEEMRDHLGFLRPYYERAWKVSGAARRRA